MSASVADLVSERVRIHSELPPAAERRRLRESAGLSQAELARIVGVTRQAVCQWESGARSTPRGPLLERYVEALRALREAVR